MLLDLAAKPHAELLLMIVEPVRKLVEAAQKVQCRKRRKTCCAAPADGRMK